MLQQARASAARSSTAAYPALLARVQALGYTELQLQVALEFIRDTAPVTINFYPDRSLCTGRWDNGHPDSRGRSPFAPSLTTDLTVLDQLLTDGAYRNQFQTRISSDALYPDEGGHRDLWERRLFPLYGAGPFVPEERPKYGALNAVQEPSGGAGMYGRAYFELTDEARTRVTVTARDSSSKDVGPDDVGTLESFAHVLLGLGSEFGPEVTDRRIREALEAGNGRARTPRVTYSYIEAQIHGPVELARDISRMVVDKAYLGTRYEAPLRELATRGCFELVFIGFTD